jgi:hypothetical protein
MELSGMGLGEEWRVRGLRGKMLEAIRQQRLGFWTAGVSIHTRERWT